MISNKLFLFPFEKIDTVDTTDDITEIANQLTNNSVRVEFKMGTPLQSIYLHASTDRGYSFIIGEEATIYEDEFKYKLFKHSKSSSYHKGDDGVAFENGFVMGNYMTDTFKFGDELVGDISLLEGSEFFLGFDLPCDSGIFGIGIYNEPDIKSNQVSIEKQLKAKDLIDNHYAFIHYTSDGKGVIGIGGEPSEYDKKFKDTLLHFVSMPTESSQVVPGFTLSDLTYNGEKIYTNITKCKISLDYSVIQGNINLKEIMDRSFFDRYISNGICKLEENEYYYFYHCKKDGFNKDYLYTLRFYNLDWNKTFEIDFKTLWKNYDDRSYFLMTFSKTRGRQMIILGEPFLRHYTFTLDLANKLVGFYSDPVIAVQKKSSKVIIVIAIISVIATIILAYFLYRLWRKRPRKLRGTELEDNYEYVEK